MLGHPMLESAQVNFSKKSGVSQGRSVRQANKRRNVNGTIRCRFHLYLIPLNAPTPEYRLFYKPITGDLYRFNLSTKNLRII